MSKVEGLDMNGGEIQGTLGFWVVPTQMSLLVLRGGAGIKRVAAPILAFPRKRGKESLR